MNDTTTKPSEPLPTTDFSAIGRSIAGIIAKTGQPLTQTQQTCMVGALAAHMQIQLDRRPPSSEQEGDLLSKIPTDETLDAIDDDNLSGRRPLPVTLSLKEWRQVRNILQSAPAKPCDAEKLASAMEFEAKALILTKGRDENASDVDLLRRGAQTIRRLAQPQHCPQCKFTMSGVGYCVNCQPQRQGRAEIDDAAIERVARYLWRIAIGADRDQCGDKWDLCRRKDNFRAQARNILHAAGTPRTAMCKFCGPTETYSPARQCSRCGSYTEQPASAAVDDAVRDLPQQWRNSGYDAVDDGESVALYRCAEQLLAALATAPEAATGGDGNG